MQRWRAQVDRSLLGCCSKRALGSSLPQATKRHEGKRQGKERLRRLGRKKRWPAAQWLCTWLGFMGRPAATATLSPCRRQTAFSLQPAAGRDSVCLSHVCTGIYVLFVTDINATASTSCSVLCPEGFCLRACRQAHPSLPSALPHTGGQRPREEQRGYTPHR